MAKHVHIHMHDNPQRSFGRLPPAPGSTIMQRDSESKEELLKRAETLRKMANTKGNTRKPALMEAVRRLEAEAASKTKDGLIGTIGKAVSKAGSLVQKGTNLTERHRPSSIDSKLQRLHERRTGHKDCNCIK